MKHAALFAGIHGFSLAAAEVGIETVWHSEIDPFCNAVAKKHYPNSKSLGDIRNVNRETAPYADIISCGFPCQPWSVAGKQLGKSDARWLGEEMYRVFRELRPPYIILENVTGFIRMALDEMLTSLEAIGYTVETFIVPAAGVNAPHRRDRLVILAYSNSVGRFRIGGEKNRERIYCRAKAVIQSAIKRLSRIEFDSIAPMCGWDDPQSEKSNQHRQSKGQARRCNSNDFFTHASSDGFKNWLYGRKAQALRKANQSGNGGKRLDSWAHFPTQPPIRTGNDGLSSGLVRPSDRRIKQLISRQRTEAIKAGGNAIVPQAFVPFFQAILTHSSL